jgi:hypothetical protein
MRPLQHATRLHITMLASFCSAMLAVVSLTGLQSSSAASLSHFQRSPPALSLRMSLRGGGGGQSTLAPKYSSNTKLKMEEVGHLCIYFFSFFSATMTDRNRRSSNIHAHAYLMIGICRICKGAVKNHSTAAAQIDHSFSRRQIHSPATNQLQLKLSVSSNHHPQPTWSCRCSVTQTSAWTDSMTSLRHPQHKPLPWRNKADVTIRCAVHSSLRHAHPQHEWSPLLSHSYALCKHVLSFVPRPACINLVMAA